MKLIRYEYPQAQGDRLFNRFFDLDIPGFDRFGGLFSDVFGATGFEREPAVDLYEDDHAFYARAELPGVRKKDIDVEIENAVLTINGKIERKEGKESSEARFSRSVSVPDGVDANKISAGYEDGVLTVTLPKAEASKPHQITVK